MQVSDSRYTNSFDFLRILGAVGIAYLHSYDLLQREKINLSVIILGMFFTVSGYLIAKSADRSTSIANYLWKRVLRIQPLLVVVCLMTVFILGPVFTKLSISDYFRSSATWQYFRTVFPVFGIQYSLPGVFKSNIAESGVNGSLWTLVLEERAYLIMVPFLFLKKARKNLFAAFVVLLNIIYLLYYYHIGGLGSHFFDAYRMQYYVLFFNSALFYFFKFPFSKINSFATIVIVAVVYFFVQKSIFATLYLLPFLTLLIGNKKTLFSQVAKKGDITYGLYVLAFPVQQSLIALFNNDLQPQVLLFLTLLICTPLAYLSWHFIEQPFLSLRNKVS
ncbi:hypothetical protein A8C56_06575 [Niabella ginsenosidivorans]|uniref:Acyltransferase 3 domain-containing protein n=1 Tax=Niabella ginsenosidivorans TaxID=1176587 RepID=A0A1A9HZ56_9BACT|nr:acyltransferase [Niabella ginsenosidivorans]ANH80688.1 hypothetical protein A8C56_06575 [Niabella ginsenosidivorans]